VATNGEINGFNPALLFSGKIYLMSWIIHHPQIHNKIRLLTHQAGGIIPLRVRMMGVALFLKGKDRK
jgi:hypothetical protein